MSLSFRDAARADLAVILELGFAGAAVPGLVKPPEPDHPDMLAGFEAISADPNHRLIVAEENGVIVGTLQISYIPGVSGNGMWRGQIENVHIRSDRRGKGLGGEVMEWAIARCRERGCGVVQLTSNKVRKDAHRFYERLGFEKSHEGLKLKL